MTRVVKKLPADAGERESDPWVGKTPWRRKWQPTTVFLPGESHGQRSLVGSGPWGRKSRTRLSNWALARSVLSKLLVSLCFSPSLILSLQAALLLKVVVPHASRSPVRFWLALVCLLCGLPRAVPTRPWPWCVRPEQPQTSRLAACPKSRWGAEGCLLDKIRCVHARSCPILCHPPLDWARQAPLSMGFPRQEYWSGLPFPSPGDLPNSGIETASPAFAGEFSPLRHLGSLK